jgi:integrase
MRAVEISNLTWKMVLDVDGDVQDKIELRDSASKGDAGGRQIPMHPKLNDAFLSYSKVAPPAESNRVFVILSERSSKMSPGSITMWFYHLYKKLGYDGASSHSGRRGFVTNAARKLSTVGASLRDLQSLTGHKHLSSLQRYIDGDTDAQRKLVNII